MRQELDPARIVQTSDSTGFAGLRVVVRQRPTDGSYGSGHRGTPFFFIGYRPGEGRGVVRLCFRGSPLEVRMTRASAVVPPERAFEVDYTDADGKLVTFEIEPRFLAEVVRRAGLVPPKLAQVPPARFLVDQRVDQLCSLLLRETERQAPLPPLYFEGLATALVIAVVSQTDVRFPAVGNVCVRHERIQKALAYIETHFPSKLTRAQMAAAAHLSDFHFSRLFRRLVGLSPEAYLLDCRLRYAQKRLVLHGPGSSIAEVAAEAGFADQSHFGRAFRRAFSQTPHDYLRQQGHKWSKTEHPGSRRRSRAGAMLCAHLWAAPGFVKAEAGRAHDRLCVDKPLWTRKSPYCSAARAAHDNADPRRGSLGLPGNRKSKPPPHGPMRNEFYPESIRSTSDRIGFEGFRALVRELPDQDEAGTGQRGRHCFDLACRPGREKGCTSVQYLESDHTLVQNRISSILPPGEPWVANWQGAAGRVGHFEVHPRFFRQR